MAKLIKGRTSLNSLVGMGSKRRGFCDLLLGITLDLLEGKPC